MMSSKQVVELLRRKVVEEEAYIERLGVEIAQARVLGDIQLENSQRKYRDAARSAVHIYRELLYAIGGNG